LQDDEGHAAIVKRWVEAFNGHDVAAIVALYADDAELFDTGMKHPRHGRGEIEQWFTTRFRTIPTIAYTPASHLFANEQAVVTWTASGRTPRLLGQGWLSRPFRVDGVSIFTLRDGLIQQQHGYYDHLSVVERALPPLKWLLPIRL
jgi:steroid delta-isomerase-like uncharacterized protein